MENNTYARPMYKCGICDTVYNSIADRSQCERKCLKKKEEEEKQAAAKKKMEEHKLRKEAVDEAIRRAIKLQSEYVKDYGHYEYEGEIIPNVFWPNKIWHYFV